MKRAMYAVIAIGLCFALNAAFGADVVSGTWKLNVAKSKYDPGPPPKESATKIEAVPGGLKFTVDGVNAEGKPTHFEWTAKFDGKDVPVKGDPNRDTAALKKVDDHTFEIVNKKDGKVTTTNRIVVSRDGKTRTVTATGTNAKGQKVNNTAVYEK